MTIFGWGLIGVVGFSLYISYKIARRISDKKRNLPISILMSLILIGINCIIYAFSANYVENSYSLIFGNKYKAMVVDYQVSKGTTTPTGSISKTQQEIYYYTALVEYQDKEGESIKKSVNYGKDKPPEIGEIIVISDRLNEDTINDISTAKSPIILFSFLFLSILISISFFLSCYGFGVENSKNRKRAKILFLICIIAGLSLYSINFIIAINT